MSLRIYVKFGNIVGDVTHYDYKGWFEANHLFKNNERKISFTGKTRQTHLPNLSEITLIKPVCSATPDLETAFYKAIAAECKIHFVTTTSSIGAKSVIEYTLSNAVISKHNTFFDGAPIETLSFHFNKYTSAHISAKNGKKVSGFDNIKKQPF